VLDCAEVANIAILNGNIFDIDLASLTVLLGDLGLPLTGLVALPTGLLEAGRQVGATGAGVGVSVVLLGGRRWEARRWNGTVFSMMGWNKGLGDAG
jgi:hypothetical protein